MRLAGERREGRRGAGQRGHQAPADAHRRHRGGRPRHGPGPAPAAGGGAVHRQRARRAGHADRPRPDLGLQQLHDRRGGPRGRLPRLPAGHRAGQPGRGAARHRGPAGAGRPDDHHRRGQHGRRARRGQGGAAAAGHRRGSARWRCSRGCRRGSARSRMAPAVAQEEPSAWRFRRDAYDTGPESAAVAAGKNEQVPIFTLPGNPVSAYVSFQVFARPGPRRAAGLRRAGPGEGPGRADRPAALAAGPALVPARRPGPLGRARSPR